MRILSSYQKLKTKVAEQELAYKKLRSDFKKYANKDFAITTFYDVTFRNEDEFERMLWSGNSGFESEINNG